MLSLRVTHETLIYLNYTFTTTKKNEPVFSSRSRLRKRYKQALFIVDPLKQKTRETLYCIVHFTIKNQIMARRTCSLHNVVLALTVLLNCSSDAMAVQNTLEGSKVVEYLRRLGKRRNVHCSGSSCSLKPCPSYVDVVKIVWLASL